MPQTETGRLLDKWIKEAIVTTPEARRARRKQVVAIEAEARQQERERLRVVAQDFHALRHPGPSVHSTAPTFDRCTAPGCPMAVMLLAEPAP